MKSLTLSLILSLFIFSNAQAEDEAAQLVACVDQAVAVPTKGSVADVDLLAQSVVSAQLLNVTQAQWDQMVQDIKNPVAMIKRPDFNDAVKKCFNTVFPVDALNSQAQGQPNDPSEVPLAVEFIQIAGSVLQSIGSTQLVPSYVDAIFSQEGVAEGFKSQKVPQQLNSAVSTVLSKITLILREQAAIQAMSTFVQTNPEYANAYSWSVQIIVASGGGQ